MKEESLAALGRGLTVLGAFSAERPVISVAEAAELLELPRSTARRTLGTLAALGFLEPAGRGWRPTARALRLAAPYLPADPVPTLLQPACDRLLAETGAACLAGTLDGAEVLVIARALPPQWLARHEAAARLPAAASAVGRMLLAGLPEPALDHIPEPRRPGLLTAIAEARREGFALVDQEMELGFRSLAVPLRRFDGRVVAALGLTLRIEAASIATLLTTLRPLLEAEAARLADRLL
ncbi:IclR family transcriptional regulator domain-containing protein [Rhodovarius crocodyli]|uniref:IclR family transcriptional regulator domain-containing protein n=1 Tax=Rhodovarius crocodyli TaxID=1979269 RepID=UPI0013E34147|nr:helix-turn-helix domain-containing protein [Rhodovarius crocodyli]